MKNGLRRFISWMSETRYIETSRGAGHVSRWQILATVVCLAVSIFAIVVIATNINKL